MAIVFRARDERLDRLVAVKILSPALAADPAFRHRFIMESRAVARVEHPHIIPVYEADEADGVLFIAMRFVPSGDLRSVLEQEGPLSAQRAAEFFSPVASALDAAHAEGLVHRDVKPANILVDARTGRPDHVYLSDFGIAKAATSRGTLTGSGFAIGTPEYSAPEQFRGNPVDGRADQYALAGLAYRMLTGAAPYERTQLMAVMLAHQEEPPPSLVARRPDLPATADQVLAKAMAKTPDQRYGSCEDFADALRVALGLPPARPGRPAAAFVPPQPTATSPAPGAPRAFSEAPTGSMTAPFDAPPRPDSRVPGTAAAPPGRAGAPLAGADQMFRAWQESARPAGGRPRATARRRRPMRRPVLLGAAPVVLIVAVAVVAVAVLTHRSNPGAASAANSGNLACGNAFPGYPGRTGPVLAGAIASAGRARLAVGSADGSPAIWRCDPSGSWTLVPAASVPALQRSGKLTSLAHGPGGWIAVGEAEAGAAGQPVAVTSGDGVTWHPVNSETAFTGPLPCVAAVAAGPNGYVAVGHNFNIGHHSYAAMWQSTDLRAWSLGDNDKGGRLDGRLRASSVNAVAATPAGFVAAGTHGTSGVIWTSADGGQSWILQEHVVPVGALLLAAVNSNGTVVAAGYTGPGDGTDVPVVLVSTDGGQHWNAPITLGQPGSQAEMTALTAAGTGFIAAAQDGPTGTGHTVTWRSSDGFHWTKHTAAASGVPAIAAAGDLVSGATQQCSAP
jgi:serine/threonine-protein kinase